jgi:5-methylcytosine-specific restriction protein A
MKNAAQIVFRRLTAADFFNINKPKGSEPLGGGQSYIDFPTSAVKPADWKNFFKGVKMSTTHSGPLWRFEVNSIGVGRSQFAEIGRRREASYNIRAQKLGTKESNRLWAWHPKYSGFPTPTDPAIRKGIPNLVIYLIRTTDGRFWAGWFQAAAPELGWPVDPRLRPMFTRDDGNIYLDPGVDFEEANGRWPFRGPHAPAAVAPAPGRPMQVTARPVELAGPRVGGEPQAVAGEPTKKEWPRHRERTEEEVLEALFSDDVSSESEAAKKQVVVSVLKRNQKIVAALKELYGGECQLTGKKYAFKKINGEVYCEAHHLIPLGEGGADSPFNVIIVNPLIHRMLHHAEVSGLDLSKIVNNRLEIRINGDPYKIIWHPRHAGLVDAAVKKADKTS